MKLKNISQAELDEVLKQHRKWLNSDYNKGNQADLSYIDLSGLDLQYANLHGANLQGSDLRYADLEEADLDTANLMNANLQGANLHSADLGDADLQHSDLQCANLQHADLGDTDLRNANLQCANLQYADLWDTNLKNAKIDITTKGINNQCPKTGSFVGYKKAYSIDGGELLVTLDIPEDAERSSATGKKCRCNKAKVLSITNINIGESQQVAYGVYDDSFKYQVGKTVEPDKWDPHFWKECTHGIHFFMDEQDALDY